ncbi:MAG: hypothetical protein V7L11_32245, partial [Nostoc sp.]|uniref:hypothetical protein n=1 Tax=Nostoc sp. TaxID=1180 RepID=UPI002FFD21E9
LCNTVQFFFLPFPLIAFSFEDVPHSCRKRCNGVQSLIHGVQRLIYEYVLKIHPVFGEFSVTPDKIY